MDRAGNRPIGEEHLLRVRSMRKRPAWLAMVAMWLTIVAPVVSQTLASHASMGEAASHASQMTHMGHGHASEHGHVPAEPPPDPDPMVFCGYCSLFYHTSVLPSVDWQPRLPGPLPSRMLAAPVASSPFVPPLLSAAPRGPPVSVQA